MSNLNDESIMERFAGNLRRLLEQSGMSQRELAARASTTQPMVHGYLHAVHKPTVPAVVRLAHALRVHPAELLDMGDDLLLAEWLERQAAKLRAGAAGR